jgi:tetratricopeptide (TPR) repeat protein
MFKKTAVLGLVTLVALTWAVFAKYPQRSSVPHPLKKGELLALVAGQSLPENIIYEIKAHGLFFTPTSDYKSLLKIAGADPRILDVLSEAKIVPGPQGEPADDAPLLQHLSNAGKLLRAGQLDEAANDLTAAISTDDGRLELGFVMGRVLMDKNRYAQAGEIYSEILDRDPAFPQVHTRLSNTYYNSGDPEEALKHAKAGEERNPEDPSAHLNAGIALRKLRSFDAAKSELLLAIRLKPDFDIAYDSLGLLLANMRDFDGAIEQFQKALALKPGNSGVRYNLAVTYGDKGDYISAIREYREVKRIDPGDGNARQNLGLALLHTDPAAAVTEFRELAALEPDRVSCNTCLAGALYDTGRFEDAKKEYLISTETDPTSPLPYVGLGRVEEAQKQYDQALNYYRKAQRIDRTFAESYTDAGRVLLQKKDFPAASADLHRAEELDPTSWSNHDLRGQALEGSGDLDGAIAEYTEALSIAPKEVQARLDLAVAQEKKGDWVIALTNYRQAAADEPPPKIGFSQLRFDAEHKYSSAKDRFQQHLGELRGSGKSTEAAALEMHVRAADAGVGTDDKFHGAMQAASQAIAERRFNDAETSAKQAVNIAERMQPQDGRLPEAVGQLGGVYAWRMDFRNAQEAYKRQLTLSEKLYGPQSPLIAPALQNLAMLALAQKDFGGAESLFSKALDLNQKTYGENSVAVAESLRGIAHVHSMQRDFPKAETASVRVVAIYETMYGADDSRLSIPLTSLCSLYDQWGKPDKSQPCHARLVSLEEKQFGANSPYLVRDLAAEAQALRQLGRADEATKIESRTQAIQSAQSKPN